MNLKYKALALAPLLTVLAACSGGSGALGGLEEEPETNVEAAVEIALGVLDESGEEPVFTEGTIFTESTNLAAEAKALLEVDLVNTSDNTLYEVETVVSFTSTCVRRGLATIEETVTSTTGKIQANYEPDGCEGSDTIIASLASGQTASVDVTVEPPQLALGINGSIADDAGFLGFRRGAMLLTSKNLSAGGQATAEVHIVRDINDTLYDRNATVFFTSDCVEQGLATITQSVSTDSGVAFALYTANGCVGSDNIIASLEGGSNTAIANLIVAPLEFGALSYVSAEPTSIGLKNLSNPALGTVSEVTFVLSDKTKNPISGERINFKLDASSGASDATLTNSFDTTDAEGIARAFVFGGSEKGTVRVIATVDSDDSLSTQSGIITITTGIATQRSFNLTLSVFNPANSWDTDGVTASVSARVSDFYNNPVAPGTKVLFFTSHGQIQPECEIGDDGGCSVTWTSTNPRATTEDLALLFGGNNSISGDTDAAAGRLGLWLKDDDGLTVNDYIGKVAIMATIKGEETAGPDENSNGLYDLTETYIPLSEAYVDFNANTQRDAGEAYVDWNDSGTFDSQPSAVFRGSRCASDALQAGACDSLADINDTIYLDMSGNVLFSGILMFDGSPQLGQEIDQVELGTGGANGGFVNLVVQDLNGNAPGEGTTVSFLATAVDDDTELEVLTDGFTVNSRQIGPVWTGLAFRVKETNQTEGGAFLGTIDVKVTNPDSTVSVRSLVLRLAGGEAVE